VTMTEKMIPFSQELAEASVIVGTAWYGRQLEGLDCGEAVENGFKRIARSLLAKLNELLRYATRERARTGRSIQDKSSPRVILFMPES